MKTRFFPIFLSLVIAIVLLAAFVPSCEGEGEQGTIWVRATLCGEPWQGAVNYTLTPTGGSPTAGTTVPQSYTVDPASWTCAYLAGGPPGSFLVDITPFFEQKVEAIRAYQSQFWKHKKEGREQGWILDYLRTNARYFGSRIGVEYAEPFFIHEEVGLRSLDALL